MSTCRIARPAVMVPLEYPTPLGDHRAVRRTLAPDTAYAALVALAVTAFICLFAVVAPVFQSNAYHSFADTRRVLRVPFGLNVLSNVPFALVGLAGLVVVWRRPGAFILAWERRAFAFLFAAVVLIAAGSAYYHFAPTTPRLFWDRLPMALVFMAILAVVVGERIDPEVGRAALVPLVAAGIASLLWWRLSGDLRPYGLVQFLPMLAVPLLVAVRPGHYDRTRDYLTMASLYLVAKILEQLDGAILRLTGLVSGHSLKHVAAAAALGALALHIARRRVHVRG